METETRECSGCGTHTRHIIDDESTYCTVCSGTDTSKSPETCEITYCSADATHLVVLKPGRAAHRGERYCASHVAVAADDAHADPTREVVRGPVVLE